MKDEILDIIKDLIELVTLSLTLAITVINYKTIKPNKKKKKRKK